MLLQYRYLVSSWTWTFQESRTRGCQSGFPLAAAGRREPARRSDRQNTGGEETTSSRCGWRCRNLKKSTHQQVKLFVFFSSEINPSSRLLSLPMVMSVVALPSVTSVNISGDTSLHFVKAMLMAFLVSSTFRVFGNFVILRQTVRQVVKFGCNWWELFPPSEAEQVFYWSGSNWLYTFEGWSAWQAEYRAKKNKIPPSKKEVAQSEGIQCNNSAQSARFNTGANSASVSLSFIQKPGITCLTHHQVLSEIRYKTHNVFIRSATQFQTC